MAKTSRAENVTATPDGSDEASALKWGKLIDEAREREKSYRKLAAELIHIYEEAEGEEIPFNILYANTETLAPALFNSDPRPDTRARAKVENPAVSAAAGLVDLYLTQFIDTGDARYASFGSVINDALYQALVPGRGITRFHYEAVTSEDETGAPAEIIDETVFAESLPFDKVIFGYARKWEDTPFIAFEHLLTYDEADDLFGGEIAGKLKYSAPEKEDGTATRQDTDKGVEVATVYEIWCKRTKKVYWLEKDAKAYLKPPVEDPYSLSGFYPIQKPLVFFQTIKSMVPRPLYALYKQQARELNRITRRITKLIEAMKIRGFFDSQVQGIEKIFDSEENTLIAIQNLAALGQGAKAENAIWLVPLDKHAAVLQQLLQNRQEILQVIYQVMGIADIMRGSTQASETLGAQEIKNRWGTLRLKRAQKLVGEFIRDGLRIAAELGFSQMSEKNLRLLTGSPLLTEEQLQPMEAQAQQAGQSGQPVPPELQQQLALPSFEDAVRILKTDLLRRYAIDIETNSTIDAEVSEDKEDMASFLNALSQFLNGLFPMVEAGILPVEVIKGVFITLSKRFRMGADLDQYLTRIGTDGQQTGKQVEEQKKQLEKAGKELQQAQQQVQAEGEKVKKEKMALEQAKAQFQMKQVQAEVAQVTAALKTQVKDAKAKASIELLLTRLNTAMAEMAEAKKEETENADV